MIKLRRSEGFKAFAFLLLIAFFFVFVVLSTFSSPLYSQQTDIDKLLEEGKKAYLDGDYEKAIQLLNQAILLIKNKSTLIDAHLSLALTYFTVNQIDNCKEQVKNILKLNPAFKPDPEFYSPKFTKLFDEVRKENTREALITSVPEGATIFINDENKGFTPFKGVLYAGKHKIRIVKEGFELLEREISVERLKENVFEFRLFPVVPTEKPVEEKPVEKPVEKKEEVKPEEEKPVEEIPVAKEKEEKPEKKKSYTALYILGGLAVAGVALALLLGKKKEEGKGNIDVKSDPTGAKIYLDGADTGKVTNAVLTNVKAGTHSMTLKKALFQDYSTSVTVSKGQTSYVNAELFAAPFTEDFNDGVANYWDWSPKSGAGSWRVAGTLYRFTSSRTGNDSFTWYDVGNFKDFTYQLDILSIADQCIAFRGDPLAKKWYLFYVWQTSQEWAVFKIEGGSLSSLKWYEFNTAIKGYPNWNNLKVVVSGTNFTFYINGTRVGSISDASYSKGKIGVYTRDFADVDVDNVNVSLSTAGSFSGETAVPILVSPEETFKKVIR